jgi:hypothetical protein
MTAGFDHRRIPIAAVQGASGKVIQRLFGDFATKLTRDGVRIAGVVEIVEPAATGACGKLAVQDLWTGDRIPISQDLGPGSTACNLDPGGLVAACAAVERALTHGVDLVIISKFGKQEAARSGLADAFGAAVVAQTPILTAVNPAVAKAWDAFAGPLAQYLPADLDAVEDWWKRYVTRARLTAAE